MPYLLRSDHNSKALLLSSTGLQSERKQKTWITPSQMKNALKDDHIADTFGGEKVKTDCRDQEFKQFLCDQESTFNRLVIEHISENVHPATCLEGNFSLTNKSILAMMQEGVPIISQAPLRNHYSAIHGVVDLLVRSDFVNKIVSGSYTMKEEKICAPKIGKTCNYHYVVVEIKFSKITINNNSEVIATCPFNLKVVAETYIHKRALALLQGYDAPAFVIGRQYAYPLIKTCVAQPFAQLPRINSFPSNVIRKLQLAAQHVRKLEHNPASYKKFLQETAPLNMMVSPVPKEKFAIARARGELTLISGVRKQERDIAFANGITAYTDKRCCAETLGITDRGKARYVDAIISVNRDPEVVYLPQNYKLDLGEKASTNIFICFEVIMGDAFYNNFEDFPNTECTPPCIYLAGVLFNGQYKRLKTQNLSLGAEKTMLRQLLAFLNSFGPNAVIWYWFAELKFLSAAINRHPSLAKDVKLLMPEFCDLMAVLKEDGFAVKGCFKYGLKDMCKAMHKNGLISFETNSTFNDGITASLNAWKYYTTDKKDENVMDDITQYNYEDCLAMQKIFDFLQ